MTRVHKILIRLAIITLVLNSGRLLAQPAVLSLNRFANLQTEGALKNYRTINFTSCKPLLANQIKYDSIQAKILADSKRTIRKNWFARKIKQESFIDINKEKFSLAIDPAFEMWQSNDMLADTATYYNFMRGAVVQGTIGERIGFTSSFYESQSVFPKYLSDFSNTYGIIPGMGRFKPFKTKGFDYGMASGLVSVDLTRWWNVTGGHGKNFIGDGYRSMILSDNAFNYPFLRTQFHYKWFQYYATFASLQQLTNGALQLHGGLTEPIFVKKPFSYQYFIFQPFRRLQLGLYQSIMWASRDSVNGQKINPDFYVPIVGYAQSRYGFNHKNNVLTAFTMRFRATHDLTIYGQYVVDDLDPYGRTNVLRNKSAYQIGFRLNNAFILRRFVLQFEQNGGRPYAYASNSWQQGYTHYNQSMAHPYGANFKEKVYIVNYRFLKDFFVQFKYIRGIMGYDSLGTNTGNNPLLSDLTAVDGVYGTDYPSIKGVKGEVRNMEFKLGYVINYKTNLSVYVSMQQRQVDNGLIKGNAVTTNRYLFFGLSSNLYNTYHDF